MTDWPFGEMRPLAYDLSPRSLEQLAKDPSAALEIGKAAEHFVCADLLLQGYRAYLSDQGLPYDVVVDIAGHLIRVQCKSKCFAGNMNAGGRAERMGYTFHVRRRGKRGAGRMTDEHCDVLALVALDIRSVAYLPVAEVGQTCQLMARGHEFKGRFKRNRFADIDGFPFVDALRKVVR